MKTKYEGWKVENSIFRDFKADSDIFLLECFESDLENTKIKRTIRNSEELEGVKKLFLQFYPKILNMFKFYSS